MFKNFKLKNKNRAFTLVETLVAISIVSLSIVSMMSVLGTGIADTNYAKNRLIAVYLAQEGVELTRNIRDTYVLYTDPSSDGWIDFKTKIIPCESSGGCFVNLNKDNLFNNFNPLPITHDDVTEITACDGDCPLLKMDSTGEYGYISSGTETSFRRKIQVDNTNPNEVLITSTVYWTQGATQKEVSVKETLFNWINDGSIETLPSATTWDVSLTKNIPDGGVVVSSTNGALGLISCDSTCGETTSSFEANSIVTLEVFLNAGYSFVGWVGCESSSGNRCTVTSTLSEEKNITANFSSVLTYPVEVNLLGSGQGTVTSEPGGIDCNNTICNNSAFEQGEDVILTANPNTGSTFVGWGGDCSGTGVCRFDNIDSAKDVTATFNSLTYTVTVNRPTNGTVTNSGFNCGPLNSICAINFPFGTLSVVLQVSPSSGYQFKDWGGDCSGAITSTCQIDNINSDKNVSVNFSTFPKNNVAVSKNIANGATITSSPSGISCASGCLSQSFDFNRGFSVSLDVNTQFGFTFDGWEGGPCDGTKNDPCVITNLNSNISMKANFTAPPRTLTLQKNTKSGGTVEARASGYSDISCDIDCSDISEIYTSGTGIELKAIPAIGFEFDKWESGGLCSGSGSTTCNVTLNSNNYAKALFLPTSNSYPVVRDYKIFSSNDGSGVILPVNRQAGDLLLVAVNYPGCSTTNNFVVPSGWNTLFHEQMGSSSGNNEIFVIFWKISNGSETSPVSVNTTNCFNSIKVGTSYAIKGYNSSLSPLVSSPATRINSFVDVNGNNISITSPALSIGSSVRTLWFNFLSGPNIDTVSRYPVPSFNGSVDSYGSPYDSDMAILISSMGEAPTNSAPADYFLVNGSVTDSQNYISLKVAIRGY